MFGWFKRRKLKNDVGFLLLKMEMVEKYLETIQELNEVLGFSVTKLLENAKKTEHDIEECDKRLYKFLDLYKQVSDAQEHREKLVIKKFEEQDDHIAIIAQRISKLEQKENGLSNLVNVAIVEFRKLKDATTKKARK